MDVHQDGSIRIVQLRCVHKHVEMVQIVLDQTLVLVLPNGKVMTAESPCVNKRAKMVGSAQRPIHAPVLHAGPGTIAPYLYVPKAFSYPIRPHIVTAKLEARERHGAGMRMFHVTWKHGVKKLRHSIASSNSDSQCIKISDGAT